MLASGSDPNRWGRWVCGRHRASATRKGWTIAPPLIDRCRPDGTLIRRPDGSWILCHHEHQDDRGRPVKCALVLGHDDDEHRNGTHRWND